MFAPRADPSLQIDSFPGFIGRNISNNTSPISNCFTHLDPRRKWILAALPQCVLYNHRTTSARTDINVQNNSSKKEVQTAKKKVAKKKKKSTHHFITSIYCAIFQQKVLCLSPGGPRRLKYIFLETSGWVLATCSSTESRNYINMKSPPTLTCLHSAPANWRTPPSSPICHALSQKWLYLFSIRLPTVPLLLWSSFSKDPLQSPGKDFRQHNTMNDIHWPQAGKAGTPTITGVTA